MLVIVILAAACAAAAIGWPPVQIPHPAAPPYEQRLRQAVAPWVATAWRIIDEMTAINYAPATRDKEAAMSYMTEDLDPDVAADVIQIPVAHWTSNCFAIATAFIRTGLVKGKACYGMWLGPIAPGNPFSGRAVTHHGWCEQRGAPEDKLIVDPTRWVFESVAPYIYVGPDDYYDKGGNLFRESLFDTAKAPPPDGRVDNNFNDVLTPATRAYVYLLLGRGEHTGPICRNELFWLGNLNPARLGEMWARELYRVFEKSDHEAIVPIDNWRDIMRGGYR